MSKAVKAVGNAVSSVVKGVVKAVTSVVKAVVDVAASVINFVAQPFMGMLGGMPDIPSAAAEAERQQGVLLQRQGSTVSVPVVYGYRKVGGIVTFAETGSTNNQYLWVAYVLSEGPIEGLRELFIDDFQIDNGTVASLNAGGIVTIGSGKYANRVQFQFYNGTYYDNPTSSPVGANSLCKGAPSWQASMAYNGLAVLFARYEWKEIKTQADADNNPFGGNIPEIQACILGKKVASLVITNPESYTYANAGVRYSTNPAEILLDYLRNPRYGKGLVNDDIEWASFRRAAAKCNQVVTYVNGITGNILTCNHVLDTGQTIFSNVKTLLMGFRAYMPYIQGKYKLRIEDAGNDYDILSGVATIVATFDKNNIQGNITYTGIERSAKYNQVMITYVDPDNKWSTQQVVYPESESERQTYIAQDGGRENKLDATFPTITNYAIAKDMARLLFNKSRYQESCSLTVSSQAMELEPGDNIYIQSNLLNFTTTPWRIITATLNDDMTYDLGCVRNPDTIYPHTRYGEEDIVLPVYVPRGATIYYPTPSGAPPIGLVPPTSALLPGSGTTDPTTNPTPTTPGDPVTVTGTVFTVTIANPAVFTVSSGHGFTGNGREKLSLATTGALPTGLSAGVDYYVLPTGISSTQFQVSKIAGGAAVATSGTQSGTHSYTSTITTANVTQPVQPVVNTPAPLDTVIKIDKADYAVVGSLVTATIQWKQPTQSNYSGVDFWYKRNIASDTVYKTSLNTDRPGADAVISHKIDGLIKSSIPYVLICRVRFSSGESSTFTTKVYLNVSGAISTEDPTDTFEIVTAGWNLNTTPLPNPKDSIFYVGNEKISGQTVFASPGVPATPRSVTFSFTQDVTNRAINYEVAGINCYYKLSADSKWTMSPWAADATYVPGVRTTFTFPGDLGIPYYPGSDDSTDNFDFIFRFRYKDGSESTYQYRSLGVDVERTTVEDIMTVIGVQELVTAYPITMVDPSTVANPLDITITLYENFAYKDTDGVDKLTFRFTPPPVTNQGSFWGLRIYWRKVTPGTSVVFTKTDLTSINKVGSADWRVSLPVAMDQEYQYIAVPLVRPTGTITRAEARSSWIGQGAVHTRTTASDYPSTGNWFSKLGMKTVETTTIPGIEATPFAQVDPYVYVNSWKCITVNNSNTAGNNVYYELEFNKDHISNYDKLVIYRRCADSTVAGSAVTKYYGLGRFERIEVIVGTNATLLASGNILVNLRVPTSYKEFNPSYPATATPPTTTSSQTFITGFMATNVWSAFGSDPNEFYLVVRSGATPTESPTAVRLPIVRTTGIIGETTSVEVPQRVLVADYNTTVSGWQRRMSEYRSRLADANYKPNGGAYTAPTVKRGGAVT